VTSDESPALSSTRPRGAAWPSTMALAFVGATFCFPIARSGIWDPFELRSIELARRIALGLFGATGLELAGASNALPTRGEVDRGELPFTSMALGLKLFGLHAWAGRLPLVVAGLIGLAATYVLVRRLVDRQAATLSVCVLGTMPLYFLHARTMLGDGMTMAALAVATAGLTLALFEEAAAPVRVGWAVLGAVGLVAGLLTRGVLLGVAVPLLGPALAWLVLRVSGARAPGRLSDAGGALLLGLGLGACLLGSRLLSHAVDEPDRFFVWLGFGVTRSAAPPTFDAVVGALGHALFPWSALLPIALARLGRLPTAVPRERREAEQGLRLTVVMMAALGLAAWGGLAPVAGVLPFGPVASLAVLVALLLRDIDRGAPASRAAGMSGAALILLLVADFLNAPEKVLTPFAVEGAHLPDTFKGAQHGLLLVGGAVAALAFFAGLLEREMPEAEPFTPADYRAWIDTVRDLWNGNLLFGACVVEAGLLGFVGFDLLGERFPSLARFAASGEAMREGGRVAWLVLPLLFVLPLATLVLRDSLRLLDRARGRGRFGIWLPSRGSLAALGGVVCGAALSLRYYPALAGQLSPEESFDTFLRLARPGEELAVVGTSSATAPYAAGRSVVALPSPDKAKDWLLEPGQRRWLMLRADALGGLNSRYRERLGRGNLPILDAHSSEILLASNQLAPGEKNQNPLERDLPSVAPRPAHPLDANLGDTLDVLGWDVTDLDGQPVNAITSGRRYDFVLYLRVVARVHGAWEVFVHIDGFQRRYNGDHPLLDGRYPLALWNVGDFIADHHQIVLEPNFTRGTYRVFVGLYSGARRMPVRRGAHEDDRLEAGELSVQ